MTKKIIGAYIKVSYLVEASKHLVGRTIKKVKWLDADSSYKLFRVG
jgi:hypothetical protein